MVFLRVAGDPWNLDFTFPRYRNLLSFVSTVCRVALSKKSDRDEDSSRLVVRISTNDSKRFSRSWSVFQSKLLGAPVSSGTDLKFKITQNHRIGYHSVVERFSVVARNCTTWYIFHEISSERPRTVNNERFSDWFRSLWPRALLKHVVIETWLRKARFFFHDFLFHDVLPWFDLGQRWRADREKNRPENATGLFFEGFRSCFPRLCKIIVLTIIGMVIWSASSRTHWIYYVQ